MSKREFKNNRAIKQAGGGVIKNQTVVLPETYLEVQSSLRSKAEKPLLDKHNWLAFHVLALFYLGALHKFKFKFGILGLTTEHSPAVHCSGALLPIYLLFRLWSSDEIWLKRPGSWTTKTLHPFRLGVTKNRPVAKPDAWTERLGSSMNVMTWMGNDSSTNQSW